MSAQPLLEIENLQTYFHTDEGTTKAVDDVSFGLKAGRTLGLVGESGSGKSVTSLSVMQLLPEFVSSIEGQSKISFLGKDLVRLPRDEMRALRGNDVAMIFQEPGTALNPVYRVGEQVAEAIRLHHGASKQEALDRTIALFEEVGIPDPSRRIMSYPHEMSGGQKQRVMIAMALSCDPKLLIADEPTTALDVTIQKQILDLLAKLQLERNMGVLFITHDLGVIAEIADEVAVMFRGKLLEYGPVEEIFANPKHGYTRGLLACRPRLEMDWRRLPTVSDFVEVETDDEGTVTISERDEKIAQDDPRYTRGRGRLLHPIAELKELETVHDASKLDELCGDDVHFAEGEPLLEVKGLKVWFPIKKGILRRTVDHVKAVDGISFNVYEGQTLGLVGESGCGKTTTGRAMIRLQEKTEGTVRFRGKDVHELAGDDLKAFRRDVQIIFQDPYGSLNPRMSVGAALREAMEIHGIGSGLEDRNKRAAKLLEEVGLLPEHLTRYPHEFSGGQRQRIGIARALAVEPKLIICDESVSALDVSVQAQVLNLLKDLQEQRGLTYVFISHDLSVVKFISDMMVVMNAGKIMEQGPSDAVYASPKEEYTQRLISAIPDGGLELVKERVAARKKARAEASS